MNSWDFETLPAPGSLELEAQISSDDIKRLGFKEFVKQAWKIIEGERTLKWNWHLDAICDHLEALDDDKFDCNRLLVNVPPRTSKSTIVTVMFPCWVWTRKPNTSFVFASYSFNLSGDHAYKRRVILESEWYRMRWPSVELASDRHNLASIENTRKGGMYTTSISGTTTGKGGDYRIMDDPNSAEQMESEAERLSTLRFVDVTWATRVNDPKRDKQIIVQQRTHTQDVTGHELKKSSNWIHVRIPMEYNPDKACVTPIWHDPRTYKGELIDAERFPPSFMAQKKIDLGPYFFAGQYDQEPYPLGGGMIKAAWLRSWVPSDRQPGHISVLDGQYHFDPINTFRFCVVDPAISEDEIGPKKLADPDYTVIMACIAIWTHVRSVVCVVDLIRERLEGPDIIPKIRAMHKHWKFSVIGVETVAFQKMLFQQAKREGLPVREISTKNDPEALYRIDKDKEARVMAATPMLSQNRVHLPEYAPWLSQFISEVTQFPNADHDDCTDALAYACAIAEKVKGGSDVNYSQEQKPDRNFQDGYRRSIDQDTSMNPLAGYESAG